MDTVDLGIEAGTRADGTTVVGRSAHLSTSVIEVKAVVDKEGIPPMP